MEAAQAAADATLYVGDHPADDVFPAKAAGLRTAHLRRGPRVYVWADDPEAVMAAGRWTGSLTQLTGIVGA
ncbi:hypothetical protein B7767_43980 [Streptomyces sp. 13-12-16]|nr:hypothetical protein B7767_43980 [Streptomyces sp. 13-12-16]